MVSKTQAHRALRSFFQRVEEHALAVFVIAVALRQKCIVVEHFFVQRPGIFREAECGVRAEQLCQIDRIGHGMGDRQVGMAGIDVHRGHIDFDLGRDFFQIEAADAASRESHAGFELHRNPFRVLANLDGERFGVDINSCPAAAYIRTNLELCTQIAPGAQGIFRTRNVGMKTSVRSSRWECARHLREISRSLARVVQKQKVPWLPFRSGTHMPESSTPGNFSGGKVTGTRMTEQKTPALPSQCQKGVPLRSPLTSDLPSGSEYLPIFRCRLGSLICADER